ncbi:UNVERIFIED_CONTAM: hypothetical protein GTU68_011919, partial [Idotea baltica]|nr:hypothetical protein [Idotea baltica]
PIHRRLPKRGFASRKRVLGLNTYSVVSIERLASQSETEFNVASLRKSGLVAKKPDRVKLLAGGTIDKAITVEVHAASASARAAIEKAGGTVKIIKAPAKDVK